MRIWTCAYCLSKIQENWPHHLTTTRTWNKKKILSRVHTTAVQVAQSLTFVDFFFSSEQISFGSLKLLKFIALTSAIPSMQNWYIIWEVFLGLAAKMQRRYGHKQQQHHHHKNNNRGMSTDNILNYEHLTKYENRPKYAVTLGLIVVLSKSVIMF